MKSSIIKQVVAVFVLISCGLNAHAQFQLLDVRAGVDTMKVVERFSFHTNAVDWLLQTPNADVEFDLRGNSWGKWSIMVGGKISVPVWQGINTFFVYDDHSQVSQNGNVPFYVNKNKEAHLEVRKYWRKKGARLAPAFYWGIRGSYGTYDIKMGETGNKGTAIFGGGSFGYVRQLYGYPSGNSLDLELGITAGAVFSDNTKYTRDSENNCYVDIEHKDKRIVPFPVVNELRAGLIYRFGNFPLSRKYRRRYDADVQYRNAYEDELARKRQMRIEKHNADSLFNMVNKFYTHSYDSIIKIVEAEEKALEMKTRASEKMEAELKKAALVEQERIKKEAEKAAKDAEKAAKDAAAEEKKAAKAAADEEKKAAKNARKNEKEGEE